MNKKLKMFKLTLLFIALYCAIKMLIILVEKGRSYDVLDAAITGTLLGMTFGFSLGYVAGESH